MLAKRREEVPSKSFQNVTESKKIGRRKWWLKFEIQVIKKRQKLEFPCATFTCKKTNSSICSG